MALYRRQINRMQHRIASLREKAEIGYETTESAQHIAVLPEALEKLQTTLEELRVADQQLHEQADILAQTQYQMQTEHERYRSLFELAPDACFVTDQDALIKEANQAASTLLNVPARFLAGKPLAGFIDKDDLSAFRAQLPMLARSHITHEKSVRLAPRGAEPFEVDIRVAPLRDATGRLLSLYWIVRDVSQRRKAESEHIQLISEQVARAEAEEARRLLDGVMRHMPAGVLIAQSPSGDLIFSNPEAERILRGPVRPWDDIQQYIFYQASRPGGDSYMPGEWPLARACAGETITGEVMHIVCCDGSLAIVHLNAAPVREANGKIIAAVATFEDITERIKAEQDLAFTHERNRRIVRVLQRSLLREVPSKASSKLAVAPCYKAAFKEALVSGDFYDVFAISEEEIRLVVGDVSGKGLEAAAHTAEVKYALRAFIRQGRSPAKALTSLNE